MMTRLLLLTCCLLMVLPLAAQPDPMTTGLRVAVQLADGTPCAYAPLLLRAPGNETVELQTGPDGSVAVDLGAGAVTVTLFGQETAATVKDGAITPLKLTLKPNGLIIALRAPEKALGRLTAAATYTTPDAPVDGNPPPAVPVILLGTDRLLLPNLPASTQSLTMSLRIRAADDRGFGAIVRKVWRFEKLDLAQPLALDLPRFTRLRVKLVDDAGQPLTGPVTGMLQSQIGGAPYDAGGEEIIIVRDQRYPVSGATDAAGMVDLGAWPPSTYTLYLRGKTGQGKRVTLKLAADGTHVLAAYAVFTKPRTITQTVFTAAGTPAVNTPVTASWAWDGKMLLHSAVTDDKGQVTWPQMPPARIIVWGPNVPAGVIAEDENTITKPLPAPVPEASIALAAQATLPENKEAPHVACAFVTDTGASRFSLEDAIPHAIPAGTRFSLFGLTDDGTQGLALVQAYVPYADSTRAHDGEADIVLSVPLTPAAQVRGRLTARGGAAVPGVSRLTALAVDPLARQPLAMSGMAAIILGNDGGFTLTTPLAGDYALAPDLYDAASPLAALPRLKAPAGASEAAVALPDPLFTVPGGTEIRWITRERPGAPRQLAIAPYGDTVAVYGPAETLLAAWGLTRPDRLLLWSAKTRTAETLALKLVTLKAGAYAGSAALAPLLPIARELSEAYEDRPVQHSERIGIALNNADSLRLHLWTGLYSLIDRNGAPVGAFRVPADEKPGFPIALKPGADQAPPGERAVHLRLPKAAGAGPAATNAIATFDVPCRMPAQVYLQDGNTEQWITVPAAAKRMYLRWPGRGTAEVALPPYKPNEEDPAATVAAWQPAAAVAGTLFNADGTPYATQPITVTLREGPTSTTLTTATDAQGRFTLANMPAGPLQLAPANGEGGWALFVPAEGLTNLTLRLRMRPVSLSVMLNGEAAAVWWKPADGAPRRLYSNYGSVRDMDLPPGAGEIWFTTPNGDGYYRQMTLTEGENESGDSDMQRSPAQDGPSLGLLFPITDGLTSPGAVTLTGAGPWKGAVVTCGSLFWQPCPTLGLIVGQIDTVPPGTWTVRVDTPKGPVERTVTVTETGASLEMAFPK